LTCDGKIAAQGSPAEVFGVSNMSIVGHGEAFKNLTAIRQNIYIFP
jgi:hypothetical protein